jgi:D-serine deaminase-like pyridoxal phosphate-dependent protein
MQLTGHEVVNEAEVPSPSILIYPERIEENIRRMVATVGDDPGRLWPHVKTHKMDGVIHLQLEAGIDSFKCATIAEAEMVATTAGPVSLQTIKVFLDIDCGMHRTGIAPDEAAGLYHVVHSLPAVTPIGLHVYDGHIHDSDLEVRRQRCAAAMAPVKSLLAELEAENMDTPVIVGGGTPTFPIHATDYPDHYCSPGTCLLWDYGYGTSFPDMDFLPAALVLTRVISKPTPGTVCLDLGHKAIASENPPPKRVALLGVPDAEIVGHSEEHLVVRSEKADSMEIGQTVYGIPWHVCPTVALHAEAVVVKDSVAVEEWPITARDRSLTF